MPQKPETKVKDVQFYPGSTIPGHRYRFSRARRPAMQQLPGLPAPLPTEAQWLRSLLSELSHESLLHQNVEGARCRLRCRLSPNTRLPMRGPSLDTNRPLDSFGYHFGLRTYWL